MSELHTYTPPTPAPLAAPATGVASIMLMVQDAINRGVSPEAIQKLADLTIQFQKIDAEKEFNAAFTAMQMDMPPITCSSTGAWGGPFEDLEGIMRQIRPTLKKYGFSVRFSNPPGTGDKLMSECTLSHIGGHSEKNSCALRPGRANKMMTETQVDAGTYYQGNRRALCSMLNIRADNESNDARVLGMPLSDEQVNGLRQHAREVGAKEATVLRMAGVERWEDIRSGALPMLHNFFNEKQMANKAKTNSSPGTPAVAPRTVGVASDSPSPGGAAAPSNAPSGFNNPGESGAVEPPAGRTFPSDSPQTTEATHDGAPRQSGRAQGSEAHAVAPVQTTPPAQTGRAGGDQWEHWRTMNASDTLSTYAAMSRDKQIQLFKNLPADVKALVKSNIEKARVERTAL